MSSALRTQLYPLSIQLGRHSWRRLELDADPQRFDAVHLFALRQRVAASLRETTARPLSAAELQLWGTLNRALFQLGQAFLAQNPLARPTASELHGQARQLELFPIPAAATDTLQRLPRNRQHELQELLWLERCLLTVQSENHALRDGRSLFRDELRDLDATYPLGQALKVKGETPAQEGVFKGRSLLALLAEPLRAAPQELGRQLAHLRSNYATLLPPEILLQFDAALALHRDELRTRGPVGTSSPPTPSFAQGEDVANFTPDRDWMPRTVLLAKAIYVWLHQLSQRYARPIGRLDQIPDEELDSLRDFGFSGLWLIGIWQRSEASRRIKHLHGKRHVSASAYAIHDYRIADDLGGDAALENLRGRCLERGIHLACDVVTNHTGIDSQWVRHHPDWFIQTEHPPYPGYRFNGTDLSGDERLCIQIEDGYYDHSEAAVVFCRRDLQSGEVRYIYHGNDGTHLPWNDTAQLNFLLPEVREAMIGVILQAAKRFGIIRFDAAMTLAKKHFQRLWYPLPGGGEGVPSRSAWAMDNAEFNRLFPVEFWREVVERIKREQPDTLLVAEAFWLMEGYFVRTLGMHRVYNSAFMNMLKREENTRYRKIIAEILAFEPAILQRFVNFMSNPDEETALEQFGNGAKYFCVATLLCTLPGMPLFAHGQLEGLREKYGMEYTRPEWQEHGDPQLLSEHWRLLAPLLRQRQLFSGAESFQLYDFVSTDRIAEDVFVFSNQFQDRRVLVLCNNSPHELTGRIGSPCEHRNGQREIDTLLGPPADDRYDLYRCLNSDQEYLRAPEDRLCFTLPPYAHLVLDRFERREDNDGTWRELYRQIGLRGANDLDLRVKLTGVGPLLERLRTWLTSADIREEVEETSTPFGQLLAEANWTKLSTMELLDGITRTFLNAGESLPQSALETIARESAKKSGAGALVELLFDQPELRNFLGIHDFDRKTWFSKDALTNLLLLILVQKLHSHNYLGNKISNFSSEIKFSIINYQAVLQLAEKSAYLLDDFLQVLSTSTLSELQRYTLTGTGGGYGGMKILFVASEAAPFAKTGGLADVVGSLPRALRQRGHDVRVVMPCYRSAQRNGFALAKGRKAIEVPLGGELIKANLRQTIWEGVPFHFIDAPEYFDREYLYGTPEGDYQDNMRRFTFFNRAVLEYLLRADFRPDILHLHDWQTALIPALLRTERAVDPFFGATATLLTIHNLGYQGIFPLEKVAKLGLPPEFTSTEHLEYFGNISFLKGGIVHADLVNTVSETYCQEIQQEEQGHGFDGLLRSRSRDLSGILNGINSRNWDPALDPALSKPFSSANLNGKRSCKRALQKELGLAQRHDLPLLAVVSRLDRQKGIDLIEQIWPQLMERELQFVLLGSGDQEQMAFWQARQKESSDRFAIGLEFDEKLSRRIYAASDCLLVPSRYEPCGLTQMIALRYGALPIVRRTGGLADTVFDIELDSKKGNGFVFEECAPAELLAAIDRALALYPQRSRWLAQVKRGMDIDFGWDVSAQRYEELYQRALQKRRFFI